MRTKTSIKKTLKSKEILGGRDQNAVKRSWNIQCDSVVGMDSNREDYIEENAIFLDERRGKGEWLLFSWYKERGREGARDLYQDFTVKYLYVDRDGPRFWSESLWYLRLRRFKEDQRIRDGRLKRGGSYGHSSIETPSASGVVCKRNFTERLGFSREELESAWCKADQILDSSSLIASKVTRRNLPEQIKPREASGFLTIDEMESLVPRKGRNYQAWMDLVIKEFARGRSYFNWVMRQMMNRKHQ